MVNKANEMSVVSAITIVLFVVSLILTVIVRIDSFAYELMDFICSFF